MRKIHRVLALLMAALMAFGLMTTAFAAEPTIDASKKASLSIYKYDITKASEDGVWDAESYVSTGLHDDAVIDKLSKYAIQGVEFTYLRVADIAMNNEVVDGQRHVGVLYGFDGSERSNAVLSAIGLTAADAHKTEGGVNYYTSDTGNPDLEKTVRESKNSTGKHNGSLTDITDGFEHTATASVGDTVDYQIISTLPTITSKASSLSEYTYVDTMSKGIRYNKQDVVIEFFRDSACTDKITTWDENSGKFAIVYDDTANTMTIRMTESGLAEINEATTVYTDSVKRGYSDCTMRISYAATLTADAKMGDKDNPNTVTLTWKRTNTTYYDTLEDCCHVFTYGIDVLKQFSDGKGDIQDVKFLLHNDSDDCYIIADLKDGIYYAKGITTKKSDATTFVPNSSGHIIVKGLEDDSYSLTETATDKGYVLLKEAVKIIIKTAESGQCEKCGAKLLTASATVNGKDVTMTDGNAIVPMTVVNNPGFDLPKTGGYGTWMFTIGGVALLGAAAFIVIRSRKHKSEQ